MYRKYTVNTVNILQISWKYSKYDVNILGIGHILHIVYDSVTGNMAVTVTGSNTVTVGTVIMQ